MEGTKPGLNDPRILFVQKYFIWWYAKSAPLILGGIITNSVDLCYGILPVPYTVLTRLLIHFYCLHTRISKHLHVEVPALFQGPRPGPPPLGKQSLRPPPLRGANSTVTGTTSHPLHPGGDTPLYPPGGSWCPPLPAGRVGTPPSPPPRPTGRSHTQRTSPRTNYW